MGYFFPSGFFGSGGFATFFRWLTNRFGKSLWINSSDVISCAFFRLGI